MSTVQDEDMDQADDQQVLLPHLSLRRLSTSKRGRGIRGRRMAYQHPRPSSNPQSSDTAVQSNESVIRQALVEQVNRKNTHIESLQTELSNLKIELSDAQVEIAALQAKTAALQAKNEELQIENSALIARA